MQLSHAGRQSPRYATRQPVGPSAVTLDMLGSYKTPRALEDGEIVDIIARFGAAAKIAQDCGFTGVSVGETLDVIDEILARKYVFTETYNTLRDLGDGSRFLDRLRKRPLKIGVRLHGSRVPSQDWFARLGNTPHQSTGRLGTSPYARTAGTTASSAAAVMREFAAATDRAGILDKADWISIGWDFTGEIDDIRGFKPDVVAGSGNQPPYPPVPYQEKLAHLAARAYDAPRLPAPSRKPAPLFRQGGTVGEVQRRLLEAVIRELKASKPIGGQRGSIWHAQEIRRPQQDSNLRHKV